MSDNKTENKKSQRQERPREDRPKRTDGQKNDHQNSKNDRRDDNNKEERKYDDRKRGGGYKYKGRSTYKEKLIVTLDTVIPPMPKPSERIAQPDENQHERDLKKIEDEIQELYKRMNDVAKELKNDKDGNKGEDKGYYSLIDLLKAKQEERGKAFDEFQAVNAEKDQYKKQLEEYYEKSNEYRFKMRRNGKKTELEAELKALKLKQSSGQISLAEEKSIIREIGEIEKSLPFAGPLEELEEQFGDVKASLKKVKKEASEKFEIYARLKEECRDIQDKIDKSNDDRQKKKEESDPAIKKMKDEYRSKIDACKEKRKALYAKQREAWNKYNEQQNEIDRIRKMQKIKDRLLRDVERKKRQEEWEKKKKEREEEQREIPFLSEIELTEQLIQYLNRLLPQKVENSIEENKNKEELIQNALNSAEWKKQKVETVVSKKDQEDLFFFGAKKKDKKKADAKAKEDSNAPQPLNHQFDALNYFDTLKVTPPLFTDKIPDTLKVLQEKKAYFQKMQEDTIKEDEEKKKRKAEEENNPESVEKTEEEKPKEEAQEKSKEKTQSPKKKNQGANPKNLDLANEQEFPKFGDA